MLSSMAFVKNLCLLSFVFLVVIKGNSQTIFTGIVKDATTYEPIENAKLYISGQGLGTMSNKGGRFIYQKYPFILTDASQLTIWAKNYEPLLLNSNELKKLQQKNATFLLEKSLENTAKPNTLEQLTVLWDHSENQLEDSTQKLNLLDSMLKSATFQTIRFIAFNNNIVLETNIINNDETEINTLITQLTKLKKEGFSDVTNLPGIENGTVLLIADNAPLFGGLTISPWVPVFSMVDYQTTVSQDYFEQISRVSGGAVLPLSKLSAQEINNYIEKKETLPLIATLLAKEVPQVFGKITNPDGTPIANATIQVAGKLKEYTSDQNGKFNLSARLGETLLFKALGKYPSSVVIEDKDTLRVEMTPKRGCSKKHLSATLWI